MKPPLAAASRRRIKGGEDLRRRRQLKRIVRGAAFITRLLDRTLQGLAIHAAFDVNVWRDPREATAPRVASSRLQPDERT